MYYCEGGLLISGATHNQTGKCIEMGLCDISWHKMKHKQLRMIRSSWVIITFVYFLPRLVLKQNTDLVLLCEIKSFYTPLQSSFYVLVLSFITLYITYKTLKSTTISPLFNHNSLFWLIRRLSDHWTVKSSLHTFPLSFNCSLLMFDEGSTPWLTLMFISTLQSCSLIGQWERTSDLKLQQCHSLEHV